MPSLGVTIQSSTIYHKELIKLLELFFHRLPYLTHGISIQAMNNGCGIPHGKEFPPFLIYLTMHQIMQYFPLICLLNSDNKSSKLQCIRFPATMSNEPESEVSIYSVMKQHSSCHLYILWGKQVSPWGFRNKYTEEKSKRHIIISSGNLLTGVWSSW